jgi:GTPase SAR1 family protein
LSAPFYKGSDVCVLVFDVTNRQSFTQLELHKKEFDMNVNPSEWFPFFVVGTHCKSSFRRVDTSEALNWCHKQGNNFIYWEIDNESGDGVRALFQTIADAIVTGKYAPFHSSPVPQTKSAQDSQ